MKLDIISIYIFVCDKFMRKMSCTPLVSSWVIFLPQ